MEAQRFPRDYNGIIAGAPANYWTHLMAEAMWDVQAMLNDPASYIPASKIPAISNAVLAACDTQDGLKDGVVTDPRKCNFHPEKLLCKGTDTNACLTAPQITALKKLYAGPTLPNGERIFPGHVPGGELGPNGWPGWITGPKPKDSAGFYFGTRFFADMVFGDPAWDYMKFNLTSDVQLADKRMGPILNATSPNLAAFNARGGKLILYHGWSDAAISPLNTINYYDSVLDAMGSQRAESFVRLYMVPGMQHCGGGPGPDSFSALPASDADAQLQRFCGNRRMGRAWNRAGQHHRDKIRREERSRRRNDASAVPLSGSRGIQGRRRPSRRRQFCLQTETIKGFIPHATFN